MSRSELRKAHPLGLLPSTSATISERTPEGGATGLSDDRVQIPVWQMAAINRGVGALDETFCEELHDVD